MKRHFIPMDFSLAKWLERQRMRKLRRNGILCKTIDKNGHHIHYLEGGSGETVLFIHGFGGGAFITWRRSLMQLKTNHHVVAYDLLWFGKSRSSNSPTLDTQLDALDLLIKTLKVKKVKLVGISYGGFVSMAYTYHNPEKIDQLIMVDSPGLTYNAALLQDICRENNVNHISEIFVPKNPAEVKRLFRLGFYKPPWIPKILLRDIYNSYFSRHHKELTQLIHSLEAEQQNYPPKGFHDKPQSLVIWGKEDAVFPLAEGKKLATYLNAPIEVIPQAGHAVSAEKFKVFQEVLTTFLKSN